MKKFIRFFTAMAVIMSMALSAVPNTFAEYEGKPTETAAALAVLRGVTTWHGEGWAIRSTSGSTVTTNADGSVTVSNGNGWNFGDNKWTLSKTELLNALTEEIENIANIEDGNSIYFDKNILSSVRGTFCESYVCEYWRRLNQLRNEKSGETWSDIDEFFVTNCIDQTVPIKYGDGVFVCAVSKLNFSDLALTHWATDNIARIAMLGYFSGYEDGTFKPDNKITHEEFTKIIVEVAGLTVTPVGSSASTTWASWAQPYLNAALSAGLITQNDKDLMQAGKPITRAEMAKLICRLRVYLKNDDNEEDELNGRITDWNEISDEYKPYVAKAYNAGILKGYDNGSFKPSGKLTRAEASTVIIKLIDEQSEFKLFVNGKLFNIGDFYEDIGFSDNLIESLITKKDILVPLRNLGDTFGISMEWQQDTMTVIFEKEGYGVCRTTLKNDVIEKKDGDEWSVCAENIEPAKIVNDRVFVPLFAVLKSLGLEVKYDKENIN